jgi:hypothetical protein
MQTNITSQDKTFEEHAAALQALANKNPVPYAQTLRIVQCEGSNGPYQPPQISRKAPVRTTKKLAEPSCRLTAFHAIRGEPC